MKIVKQLMGLIIVLTLLLTSFVIQNNNVVSADSIGGDMPADPLMEETLPVADYDVTSDIVVPAGKTLHMLPGSNFKFNNGMNTKITVLGTLNCIGTPTLPITFKSNRVGPLQSDDWQGFIINGGAANFNHTLIESAQTAIKAIGSNPLLNFVTIRKASSGIDASSNSWPKVYNSTIEDCLDRDIKLVFSKLNLTKSHLKQTGIGTLNPAIDLNSLSRLKVVNSSIDDKYKYFVELNGMSYANFLQSSLNHSVGKIRMIDPSSVAIIKNFLDIYVGTKTSTGEDPLANADVTILDDNNAVHNVKTNSNGEVKFLELTHLEYSAQHPNKIKDNKTDIKINYANIFQPVMDNINMSQSREEQFVNDIPRFNFQSEYTINEDSKNTSFIDLWDIVDDDFDADDELRIQLVTNTAGNISGKKIAFVDIRSNRYLDVDLESGDDNDNWTGTFHIQINATNQLGLALGLINTSDMIPIRVVPVNDPPMWFDISNIHLKEDNDFLNVMDVMDHIYDVDTDVEDITFDILNYDKTNFYINIDSNDHLNIRILNENHTSKSSVTLSAFDQTDYGYYVLDVIIDSEQDSPAINRSLADFSMKEDTIDTGTVELDQIFFDSDGDNLTYHVLGDTFVTVDIDPITSLVTFQPDPDWFGQEVLTFYATDSIFGVNDTMVLTVEGTNDPPEIPVINHPSESTENIYKVGEPILFSAHAFDIDIDNKDVISDFIEDKLSYSWTVNTSKEKINVLDNFTYADLPEGYHRVTVTVTDIEGEGGAEAFVDILVFGEYEAPSVNHLTPLPDYWTNVPNVRLEWSVDADVEALFYIRYDVRVDEMDGTTVIAERIKTTFYTVSGLRPRTKYFWSIIPYISNDAGDDLSGTWFFTYDPDVEQIFDLSLSADPLDIMLYPGQNATVSITVSNLGNMPDRFEVVLGLDNLIKDQLVLSKTVILGLDDGIYGMTANEKESLILTIDVPKDFKFSDTYEVTITVQSMSRDTKQSKDVNLKILELEEDDDGSGFEAILGSGSSMMLYVIVLIIVIIIAVLIIVFAFYHKRKSEEEHGEDEDEVEERAEIPSRAGGAADGGVMPMPAPVSVPVAPTPAPAGGGLPGVPTPVTVVPAQAEGGPQVAPMPVPVSVPAVAGDVPPQALPEGTETVARAGEDKPKGPGDFGTVTCGPCGADIPLTSDERPLDVTCPECGNTFTIKL